MASWAKRRTDWRPTGRLAAAGFLVWLAMLGLLAVYACASRRAVPR